MKLVPFSIALLALCSLGACDLLDPEVCTDIAIAGIGVVVVDSVSGAPITVPFKVAARDGAYTDSVLVTPSEESASAGPYALAFERTGTYRVEVTADDYQPWSRTGVTVRDDGCHVHTEVVDARLRQ
jgi:hypothetical protein